MSPCDLIIKSRRVVTPEGERPASILVENGLITELRPYDAAAAAKNIVDAGNSAVLPGLVDTHVHVNEPGRAEWEGFETATRAAAAGGITTIIDMPLNSIPVTTTLQALRAKRVAAEGRCAVDVGFWGGVVPGNAAELEPMTEAGVFGFKAFLVHSGIDDFPNVAESDLRKAMTILASHGVPLLVHAELAHGHVKAEGDPRAYGSYLASRPKSWENEAIKLIARLCRETAARAHIVHLSSAEALPILAEAKATGARLTAETCPHYLFFSAEEIPDGSTEFKCSPPIRESENREKLWAALKDGLIDFVVSDHSPCVPELKAQGGGDFQKAWGGISSLQFAFPAVWTQARQRGFTLSDLARWMSESPARFAGLSARKGRVAPGFSADLAVVDPKASFKIEPGMIRHRHPLTPYAGRTLYGKVERTFLAGTEITPGETPRGKLLKERAHELHRAH